MDVSGVTKKGFSDVVDDSTLNEDVRNSNDEQKTSPQDKDDLNFTIKIYKTYRIRIYKPLIPLKLVLFFWHGAASFTVPFLNVHFKQRGITLSEVSLFFILSPISQFLGTIIAGVTAEKLGKFKPVLVVNLILTATFLAGITFIPRLDSSNCASRPINLKCHPRQFDRLITKTSCDVVEDTIEVKSCNIQCPENVTEYCDGKNLICEMLAGNEEVRNFSLSIHVNGSHNRVNDRCYYPVSSMSHENITDTWCNVPHKMYCRVKCTVDSGVKCFDDSGNRSVFLKVTMVLFILFLTNVSNCHSILDATTMSLVKEHDSYIWRERFVSTAGVLLISPITGYIVDVTSPEGGEKNCAVAFYIFIGIVFLLLGVVYFLEVQVTSPGKKMWKHAVQLLKNPDVVSFMIILFVLGTAFIFTKNYIFWYLEELGSTGFLTGLIPAVGSLCGLPFLITSRWWVKKIGSPQIFILALLGYVVNTTGYSFLLDPWYSLILEVTNILTYQLLWVAVIVYSHELSPEGLTATVISTATAIHYHIGKVSAGLIGRTIMDTFGVRIAFRVLGTICLICSVLYGCYLQIRRIYTVKPHIEPQSHVENELKDNDHTL